MFPTGYALQLYFVLRFLRKNIVLYIVPHIPSITTKKGPNIGGQKSTYAIGCIQNQSELQFSCISKLEIFIYIHFVYMLIKFFPLF